MIKLKNIYKKYSEMDLFTDLNTYFGKDSVCIVGRSGVGKTTLLRIIAGLESIGQGEIWLNNTLMTSSDTYVHPSERNISYVFQNPTLWPHMSVYENIGYGLSVADINVENRILKMIDALEIRHIKNKKPHHLSGGEAKRVAVARALVRDNPYLLMDEPLVHLDQVTKELVIRQLKNYLSKGTQLIYVTHDEDMVMQLGLKTFVLEPHGKLQEKEGSNGLSNS